MLIDEHNRLPVVEILRSTSSEVVIPKLDSIFAMFGIPAVLKSDNGPPFNGNQMSQYASHMGFKHRKITPYWPQANAEAERFMRNLGKVVTTATVSGSPWKQQLYKFLLVYRATPHTSTKVSPAESLFGGRNIHVKLPEFEPEVSVCGDQSMRLADQMAKTKMKFNSDKHTSAKPSKLCIGDTVIVKQYKRTKTTPFYDPLPYTVSQASGSMITATRPGHTITRIRSLFKKLHSQPVETAEYSSDDDELPLQRPINQEPDVPGNAPPVQHPPAHGNRSRRENRRPPERYKDYVLY